MAHASSALTGMTDDGTAGLIAVKRCGGVTVVQDPRDAAYSGMPLNALDNSNVDFCVSTAALRNKNRARAKETQGYIDRIRAMLLDPRSDRPDDTLTHVTALMAEPRKAKSTR
jgi:hypothetical protein